MCNRLTGKEPDSSMYQDNKSDIPVNTLLEKRCQDDSESNKSRVKCHFTTSAINLSSQKDTLESHINPTKNIFNNAKRHTKYFSIYMNRIVLKSYIYLNK